MNKPLVTVICVCFNKHPYLRQAVQSVLDQSYPHVELIIVDAGSNDGSKELIDQLIAANPGIKFLPQDKKLSYSKAFNTGLKHSKGEYIIDFAAENILHVNRIGEGLKGFEAKENSFDVNYTDAEKIDESGNSLEKLYAGKPNLKRKLKDGYIFKDILANNFICPQTLMYRKEVFDELKGYKDVEDPHLDFLLRSSRDFKFFYIDQPLAKLRILPYTDTDKYQYKVIKKATALLRDKQERKAWRKRVRSEIYKAIRAMNWKLALKYWGLWTGRRGRSVDG